MRNKVPTRLKLEFVYAMAKHTNASIGDCQRLMRYGATIGAIAERQRNGYQRAVAPTGVGTIWDEQAAKADTAKQQRLQFTVSALCHSFGAKAIFQHDPRGNTVKITPADGYTNDCGKEGICVPTS